MNGSFAQAITYRKTGTGVSRPSGPAAQRPSGPAAQRPSGPAAPQPRSPAAPAPPSTNRKRSRTSDTKPLALVTGASSGIGLELAEQLAERGYDLVVNAEDDARLQRAAQRVRAAGARVEVVRADLRDPGETERLFAEATGLGRPLDVVVLNAGVGRGGAFVDTDLADELEVIDLNVRSTVHLAKLVLRDMDALFAGKDRIVAGSAKTKAQAAADKLLPDSLKAEAHRKMAEPGSGDEE